MKPTIGRIVLYTLKEQDVVAITKRRLDFEHHQKSQGYVAAGYQAHVGNSVRAGDTFPAVVVRVWQHSVNLRVILDGIDDYWATSVSEAPSEVIDGQAITTGHGNWHWPPRV